MNRIEKTGVEGIYVATVCPLTHSLEIDETALRGHMSSLAGVPGIKGLLINGHAGENFSLTRDEKRRVVEIARDGCGDAAILVCGVNAESTLDAVDHARDVAAADGDAVMVFPPNSWALSVTAEAIVAHHRAIIEATDLPIFLYQAPVFTGPMAYSPDVISKLITLPRVAAIKEGSWETATYEANRRLVKDQAPTIAVMASGDEHLLSSFVLGSDGSLVSLAAIIPKTIIALDDAVRRGDLKAARETHEIIYPLATAIYGTAPAGYATARLKTCLKLLGRLDCDAMRPPIPTLPRGEIDMLWRALSHAGLVEDGNTSALNA